MLSDRDIYGKLIDFWRQFLKALEYHSDIINSENYSEFYNIIFLNLQDLPDNQIIFHSNNTSSSNSWIDFFDTLFLQKNLENQFIYITKQFSQIIMERNSEIKSKLGQVFTPITIVKEIISNCNLLWKKNYQNQIKNKEKQIEQINIQYYFKKQPQKFTQKHWLDVGCGSGFFITWILIQELQNHPFLKEKKFSHNNLHSRDSRRKSLWKGIKNKLAAVDLDPLSIFMTIILSTVISLLFIKNQKLDISLEILKDIPPIQIFQLDFLDKSDDLQKFEPTIIIGNPPYIFYRELSKYYLSYLRKAGYQSANGQFDISDVFIERSLRLLPPNGILGLIIPETILTLNSRQNIRKLIVSYCDFIKIKKVSNTFLTAVVENIEIFLHKTNNDQNGHISIEYAESTRFHGKKSNLLQNFSNLLNLHQIDKSPIVIWLKKKFISINEWNRNNHLEKIHVFRGVELSKKGEIMQCPSCKIWMPFSEKRLKCKNCHQNLPKSNGIIKTCIIQPFQLKKSSSALLKSNLNNQKYFLQNFSESTTHAEPDSLISLGYKGIQYKSLKYYENSRIIVRQLLHNMYICAASVDSGILTSQSIYNIILPKSLHSYQTMLINQIRSELSAYYLFMTFSHGKRLFPRILLSNLKELPFIPLNIIKNQETTINHMDILPFDYINEIQRTLNFFQKK
ncbi:Eco57I restriction-modification methylase domain-containing protein [Candidatus Harpocratesius sp.]